MRYYSRKTDAERFQSTCNRLLFVYLEIMFALATYYLFAKSIPEAVVIFILSNLVAGFLYYVLPTLIEETIDSITSWLQGY